MSNNLLKKLTVGIFAAAVCAVGTMTGNAAQVQPRSGGELVFPVPSEPPSYDGHKEETFGLIHPIAPHYNGLLRFEPTDPTGTKPAGDLAESWTISKDGLVYTFKLHKGVKFHDGSEMTAKDVKASYDHIIFPPAGVFSTRKGQYEVVEAVDAVDPYTVRFRLKWATVSFLASLASPWNFIYKADILAKDPHWYETNIMGTGPFVFVEHVKGSHWVGKKNPNYWVKGKPYLDGYRALFIRSSSAQVAAVRGERAHIQFRGFTPADRDTLKAALGDKITVQESSWDCVLLVAPNQKEKPFDDKRVRRALTRARPLQLQGVVEDRHRQGSGRCPGARYALRHAPRRTRKAGRLLERQQRVTCRGQEAAQGSGSRETHVHVHEPRRSHALRAARRVDDRPVAAGRGNRQAGGCRSGGLLRDAPQR